MTVHPSFEEALRIRQGVRILPGGGMERERAMVDLIGDKDGSVALGLMALSEYPNRVEAVVIAFLAGMLKERDDA